MNLFLRIFNLLGVAVLAVLLTIQWQVNSRVNRRADNLEIVRQKQQATLEESDRTIAGCRSDLDEFRDRLAVAETQLTDLESKLNRTTVERNQLAAERDQLRSALNKWMAAVTERDSTIKQAVAEIKKLTAERDELLTKYNSLVKDWNDRQSR